MYFVSKPIVTNGLVLNLDAGNALSYTSGSSTWRDLSGNNFTGSLINNPSFSLDNNISSIVFDGTNYVLGTNIPSSSYTNGFTVMSFHKLTSGGSYPTILGLGKINAGNQDAINIGYYASSGKIQSYLNTTVTNYATTLNPVTLNKITCVTATWDGLTVDGTLRFYINDKLENTTTTQGALDTSVTSSAYRVGNRGSLDIPFIGNIYNVQIYNRALSSSEVQQNFNALKGRYGI